MIKLFIIGLFAFIIAQVVMRFVKGIQTSVSNANSGKAVHIQTPIGTLDLKPNATLHPALATILLYPGATPLESQPPEYEADIAVFGREFQILAAGYWTATPEDVVWQFYRRELPGWEERHQGGQRFLIRKEQDCERSVRVYAQNGRTQIQNRVTTKHLADAASAGASSSSIGVLR